MITAVPLYEYNCEKDGRFELIRKFSDPPVKVCPTCGRKVEKLLSSPAIQFKGTGWYITDYARKGKDGSGKDSKDSSKDSGSSESSSKADGSSKADSSSKSDSPSKSDSSPQSTPSKSTAASGSSSSK